MAHARLHCSHHSLWPTVQGLSSLRRPVPSRGCNTSDACESATHDGGRCASTQSKDAERIRDFLVQHTPHKIFLGGACMQCAQLYEDLQKVLDHILDRMPSAFTRTETGYIELNWADESLAALWETSEPAKQEMGDQLPLVRRAVRPPNIHHTYQLNTEHGEHDHQ